GPRPAAPGAPRAAAPRMPGGRSPRGPGAGPRTTARAHRGVDGPRGSPRPSRRACVPSCSEGLGARDWGLGGRDSRFLADTGGPSPEPRGPALFRPRHHGAQRRPHLLDQVIVLLAAHALEVGTALAALLDPLTRERAALDVGQDLLHPGAHGGRDERGAAGVVA